MDRDFENEPNAGRYTPLEEHWRLRERVTVLESDIKIQLSNIHMKLDNMASRAALTPPPTSSMDGLSLALQRMMDTHAKPQGGGVGWALGMGAMVPVVVFLVYQFVTK